MKETKTFTCVVCPRGCRITVTTDDGAISSISGYTCPRGKAYAESEVMNPVRTLTSSVRIVTSAGERMLPVRTDKPIPKSSLFDAMTMIHNIRVHSPVHTGDVLVSDFIEQGVNLVATKDFI